MSLDKVLWRGKATWTGKTGTGPENDIYNAKPMWRYNSYFGIHTVHYLTLVGTTRAEKLPMGKIVAGVIRAALTGGMYRRITAVNVMNTWTRSCISKTGNLKFFAFIDTDGYPCIIPCLSARATDTSVVYIPGSEYGREIAAIPEAATVCLFCMSLDMEDVVVRGTFRHSGGGGVIAVDWVYNSMPPVAKQIYPPEPAHAKVTDFDIAGD